MPRSRLIDGFSWYCLLASVTIFLLLKTYLVAIPLVALLLVTYLAAPPVKTALTKAAAPIAPFMPNIGPFRYRRGFPVTAPTHILTVLDDEGDLVDVRLRGALKGPAIDVGADVTALGSNPRDADEPQLTSIRNAATGDHTTLRVNVLENAARFRILWSTIALIVAAQMVFVTIF